MRNVLSLVLACSLTQLASAEDWPQILGPNRNGRVNETLVWATSPEKIWSVTVGEGFAGPVVVGSTVLLFDRLGDSERLRAFDRTNGKELWLAEFPATYRGGINPDSGPRCVPVVVGETAILFGASGDAHAVNISDGTRIWSRELLTEYKGKEGYFGAGSTPIAIGKRVLFNVGARTAGIVALDLERGKTVWKATDAGASYSSPIVISKAGKDLALFVTRLRMFLIDPANGAVVASHPFGKRGPTVNGASPVLTAPNRVLLTSSYGIGACLLDLSTSQPKPIWENDASLSSQYNTPVLHNGYLYGIHGREDMGAAALRCVNVSDGKVAWSKAGFGVAHSLLIGDDLLLITHEGDLVAAKASPNQYRESKRATISNTVVRAIPAFSDGVLYFRDEERLTALRLE